MLEIVCTSSPLEAVGNGELVDNDEPVDNDVTGASVLSHFSSSEREKSQCCLCVSTPHIQLAFSS